MIINSPETQQTFVDLLQKNINSMFSIPESINQYQNSIANTHVKIDYVVGIGLYMIPSNLVLKTGSIEKYNNNIVIAGQNMKLGYNENINKESLIIKPIPEKGKPIVKPMDNIKYNISAKPNSIYLYAGVSVLVFGFCFYFRKNIFWNYEDYC